MSQDQFVKPDRFFPLSCDLYASPWIENRKFLWNTYLKGIPVKTIPKNSVFYSSDQSDNCIYFVKSGRVRLDLYSSGGKKRTIYILGIGMLFGEDSCLDFPLPPFQATAVTDCKIYSMPVKDFLNYLSRDLDFSLLVLQTQMRKSQLVTYLYKQLTFHDSRHRIISALAVLAKQYSLPYKDTSLILTIRVTQQELADLTGLSRVQVSNILGTLQQDGILRREKGYFVICNPAVLRQLAEQEP